MVYHEGSMHRNCTAPGWDSSYRTWRIWEHLQLEGRWGILRGYWGPYSLRSCLLESLTLLIVTTVIIFFIAALCLKQLGINVFGKEEFHKMFCNLSFLFMTIILKSQSAHIGRVKEQNAVKTAWKNESSHLLQGVPSHWISWILLELWPLEYFSTIILNFTDQTTCSFSKQTPKMKTNQGAQHLLHMLLGGLPCALHGSWTQTDFTYGGSCLVTTGYVPLDLQQEREGPLCWARNGHSQWGWRVGSHFTNLTNMQTPLGSPGPYPAWHPCRDAP